MRIVISSGHGLLVRGARGLIDEVDEARRVTNRVAEILRQLGVTTNVFHENNARTQSDNVGAIVRHHNSQQRDLDVSIHFNSTATGLIEDRAIGVEVLHHSNNQNTRVLAGKVARAISDSSGILLRHKQDSGAVGRTNLSFLTNTSAPAILIEVCFVVSRVDVRLYTQFFNEICTAIATTISGRDVAPPNPPPVEPPPVITPPVVPPPVVTPPEPPPVAPQPPLPPSDWAKDAWAWGVNNNLTDGSNPRGVATREQMLTLLHRYHTAVI